MIHILRTSIDEQASLFRHVGCVLLASMTAVLGAIAIYTGDFAYTWQPVPEELPARALAARITGIVMIALSALMLLPRTARRGVLGMTGMFALWLLLLHVPRLITGATWLGSFEFLLPLGACLALIGMAHDNPRLLAGDKAIVLGRICFGVGLIGCGVSHFVYADGAAQMIPEWIPGRLFFTYLTGVGHIAAGLSLLADVLVRISTVLLCFMLACFVLLLHVPRVIANPGSRYEWTMLFVATLFNGAAWLIAAAVRSRSAMRSVDMLEVAGGQLSVVGQKSLPGAAGEAAPAVREGHF